MEGRYSRGRKKLGQVKREKQVIKEGENGACMEVSTGYRKSRGHSKDKSLKT